MFCKVYHSRNSNAKDGAKYMTWTNEMDLCLSKILVEHAKKGCKSDIIKTSTYAAAVAELNEKFGLHLTKDHIKNRLKTWRKQYAILKEILAQKGFKWDKAQNMIVANDTVWNNYIKVHPDARHFRGKFVENYDELFAIVGNDEAVASPSDDGAEADVGLLMSEKDVLEIAIDSDSQTDDKLSKNLRWTKEMDICLGEILVEQVKKGYKIDNFLQREAYEAAVGVMNEKFGLFLTKDHVRNRLKTWKKQFGVLKELLSHTAFKWNDTHKMVIGSDSDWNDYIKTHHDARVLRGKVIDNYEHLCVIFGNNHATGSYSRTADDIVHSLAWDSDSIEASKDRAKTIRWTKEMDRFLSSILVEQVKLGNKCKLDNKIKPEAFVVAVSALNQMFELNFTKENVVNRIKTWKKLYGNVKEILERNEFRWDRNQKMVIAKDSSWFDYIKINPEARFLRERLIENYDDLRIIVGNEDPTESSTNDIKIDLDWTAEDSTEADFSYRNPNTIWTNEMDICLSKKLIEQIKMGNNNINTNSYEAVLDAVNRNFGVDLTKDEILCRLKSWKKLCGIVKEALSVGGFEWDERRKMVVANDASWNEYIKTHPDASILRQRTIENYKDLSYIIENWFDTSDLFNVNVASNNEEEQIENPTQNTVIEEDGTQGSSKQTRARPYSSDSKQPLKKMRESDLMADMISAMATNIGRIADALTECNSQRVCLDELFEIVQNIPGFDDDLIVEACEFLSCDERRARMFLKLNDRLRKLWLLKRLRGHSQIN